MKDAKGNTVFLEEILQAILTADQEDTAEILKTALLRYEQLYPSWEVSTLSIEKDRERNAQIDNMIHALLSLKQQ